MDILKIIGIGLTGAFSALVIREYKPTLSLCITLLTATLIFTQLVIHLGNVLDVVQTVAASLSLKDNYLGLLIRIIGISYLVQLGSSLCRDAGQNALAQTIELSGKIIIVSASIPILTAVLNLLTGIL